jgi:hypothetical protein
VGLLTRVFRAGAVPGEVLAAVEECIANPPGDFSYALLNAELDAEPLKQRATGETTDPDKATWADIRLAKERRKLRSRQALEQLRTFAGTTIDLKAEAVRKPAKLTDADVGTPERDEAECARMREKLRSIGIGTDASRNRLGFLRSSQ